MAKKHKRQPLTGSSLINPLSDIAFVDPRSMTSAPSEDGVKRAKEWVDDNKL